MNTIPFRRSKFNAKKTTVGGVRYDSKFEARYSEELEWRKRAGEILSIQRQVRLSLNVEGVHICDYVADFLVTLKDGRRQYHECKGYFTPDSRLKWKLVQALAPQIDPGAEWILVRK